MSRADLLLVKITLVIQYGAKVAERRFVFDSNHKFSGWASWEQYAACSTQCVSGYEKQTKECCDTGDNRLCYNLPWNHLKSLVGTCPVDGNFGDWSDWTQCSKTCGGGVKFRTRSCMFDAGAPKGNNCTGSFSERLQCNTQICPVDGRFGSWSAWTQCSQTCGGGVKFRTRSCIFYAGAPKGGNCTGSLSGQLQCNTQMCPVDGRFGSWSVWTQCSQTCGGGVKSRTRSCMFDARAPKGDNCTGSLSEQLQCSTQMCPVDGRFRSWSAWTQCSQTCGGGVKFRTRSCMFDAGAPKGDNCTGSLSGQLQCNTQMCSVDGKWSDWSNWSSCSATCNIGSMTRSRTCDYDPAAPHGAPCPGNYHASKLCQMPLCPVDGVWTQWSAWGTCSGTCGHGNSTRQRVCEYSVPLAPHGSNCTGESVEHQACGDSNRYPCPVDGTWLAWSNWNKCSVTCGGGTQRRHRSCHFPPHKPQGNYCNGPSRDTQTCNNNTCPATTPRSCYTCQGPPAICEKLNFPTVCPLEKQFCINTLSNFKDASRNVDMKCGTREECQKGWFDKYAKDDKCARFSQNYIYTNQFYCEFCCDTDNCNQSINPPNKWHP